MSQNVRESPLCTLNVTTLKKLFYRTATMFAQSRLKVKLNVHFMSCCCV